MIREDFEYEMRLSRVNEFPFKEIIKSNKDFKEAFFKEFSELSPRPKLDLYYRNFISDEEWAKDRDGHWQSIRPSTGKNVMANFIKETPLAERMNDLHLEFEELKYKDALDKKYYGRYLEDTNTAKTLKDIKNKIDAFEGYVLLNSNVDKYDVYAESFCESLIYLTSQLRIPGLKNLLLNQFIDNKSNSVFIIKGMLNQEFRRTEPMERYNILKLFADKLLLKEIKNTPPDHNKILSEISESENLFWKGLPMEVVIKHFEVLTIRKSKNGNVFLTFEQFLSFLKKGFLNDASQLKQKINCVNTEKGFVIKRFHEFFVLATSQYSHPNKTAKFVSLFVDCFDNWPANSIPDLFKPNKSSDEW